MQILCKDNGYDVGIGDIVPVEKPMITPNKRLGENEGDKDKWKQVLHEKQRQGERWRLVTNNIFSVDKSSETVKHKANLCGDNYIKADRLFLVLSPILFLIFNCVYWLSYCNNNFINIFQL